MYYTCFYLLNVYIYIYIYWLSILRHFRGKIHQCAFLYILACIGVGLWLFFIESDPEESTSWDHILLWHSDRPGSINRRLSNSHLEHLAVVSARTCPLTLFQTHCVFISAAQHPRPYKRHPGHIIQMGCDMWARYSTSIWDIIYMLCLNVTNIILTIISLNHPNTFDYGK